MKKTVLLLIQLSLVMVLCAQHPVKVVPQDNVRLLWHFENLSVVDGRLYGSSNGLLMGAAISDGRVGMFAPDSLTQSTGSDCSYLVRNPQDSLLYYIRSEASGGRGGFFAQEVGRFHRDRQVDERIWDMTLEHPTFSPNGRIMVFSSQHKVGLGGYDLWCSFWNGKRWTKPLNMGNSVNTAGNEVNPVFYGNYLIYSTNLRQEDSTYVFYAVYIRPNSNIDSILFCNYKTQRLPEPLNSSGSDVELALEPSLQRGYWISDRGGRQELYSFEGRLDGVMLIGTVADEKGRPVADAEVEVLRNGRQVGITTSDIKGRYHLFVQPGEGYELSVRCSGYYHHSEVVSASRADNNCLVAEDRHNVTLSYLPLNRVMVFDRVYRHGADVELSEEGRRTLAPLADFLRDNPEIHLDLNLLCNQSDDSVFNDLVIERRISDLRQYFHSVLPTRDQISYFNGNNEEKNEVVAGGQNIIFAVLRKRDK